MRSSFWVVLGLVGALPLGALAQEVREQPAGQARASEGGSNEALQQQINELWQNMRALQQQIAGPGEGRLEAPGATSARPPGSGLQGGGADQDGSGFIIVELPPSPDRSQAVVGAKEGAPSSRAGVGGSGSAGQELGQAAVPLNADLYMGWVRAVTGDRLLLEARTGNIYELGIDETTRFLGYQGRSVSPQALEEGTFVRAVATEGEQRDQVRRLDILAPPVPEP